MEYLLYRGIVGHYRYRPEGTKLSRPSFSTPCNEKPWLTSGGTEGTELSRLTFSTPCTEGHWLTSGGTEGAKPLSEPRSVSPVPSHSGWEMWGLTN